MDTKKTLVAHWPMMVLGLFVLGIFAVCTLLFSVREEEIALKLRFGSPQRDAAGQLMVCHPGLHLRWPYPIEDIWRIDGRVHNYELDIAQVEQTPTKDGSQLLLSNFVCWCVDEAHADRFMVSIGSIREAERILNDIMRDARGTVIPQYELNEIINKDPTKLKRSEMEQRIRHAVAERAKDYGMKIVYVGFKHTGFPEEVCKSVFEKMTSDRRKISDEKRFAGESEAKKIRSRAEAEAAKIKINGESEAAILRAKGMTAAADYMDVYAQNQELAIFLRKLEALKSSVGKNTILFFDTTMPPFDLLDSRSVKLPSFEQAPASPSVESNKK